jgi:hypothetical protein
MKGVMMKLLLGFAAIGVLVVFSAFRPQDFPRTGAPQRFDRQQDSTRLARMNAEVIQKIDDLRKRIAGQEDKPATEVFKNIKRFKDGRAGQIPGVMENWSRSLGISCEHCHVSDQWEKEDRSEKQVARDMDQMVDDINSKLLANIKNLDSKNPRINCYTCHGGRVKPVRPPWLRNQRRED